MASVVFLLASSARVIFSECVLGRTMLNVCILCQFAIAECFSALRLSRGLSFTLYLLRIVYFSKLLLEPAVLALVKYNTFLWGKKHFYPL